MTVLKPKGNENKHSQIFSEFRRQRSEFTEGEAVRFEGAEHQTGSRWTE